ncbi:hypothetical protein Aple_016920 [Acrocarpospora pleiomorpha]|uniref:CHAT domain-containing protein n=1 Tax=Acrocarpospora pleiomorpha TaxID=90975 RepID=A0A5M3XAT4_9ACTN|nr:CHAT domain-containing protein [Acrocarpospora pleiomorpha]GES18797.1 hypothetical protein Aple_016920 [Acrocarpospora pleiomorpha]
MSERDDLLDAVRGQLQQVSATGDPTPLLTAAAVAHAKRLTALLIGQEKLTGADMVAWHVLGWWHWYRYQALPEGQNRDDLVAAVTRFGACFLAGITDETLPEPLLPFLADQAAPAALAMLGTVMHSTDGELLDQVIRLWQRITALTPPDHPDHARSLGNLAIALRARFENTGVQDDLDRAIAIQEYAVKFTPPDHSDHAGFLNGLGISLQMRFENTGVQDDLDRAVTAQEYAVKLTLPDHPDHAGRLSNLATALRARFLRIAVQADLDRAVTLEEYAVKLTPPDHPDYAAHLNNLAIGLQARFERTRVRADLDRAVTAQEDAVKFTSPDHPNYAGRLTCLAIGLQMRFENTGVQADLDRAVTIHERTVKLTPPNHPGYAAYLGSLGMALQIRFLSTGVRDDLDQAVTIQERVVELTPPDHPDHASRLTELGIRFQIRFDHTGVQADREAAVSAYERVTGNKTAAPSWRIRAAREAARLTAGTDPAQAAGLLETAVRLLPEVSPRQLERSDQQYAIREFAGLAAEAAAQAMADPTTPADLRGQRALRLLEAGRAVILSQILHTRSDISDLTRRSPDLAARFTTLRDRLDSPASPAADPIESPGPGARAWPRPWKDARRQVASELADVLHQIKGLDGFASFAQPPTLDELQAQAGAGPIVTFNISPVRSDALILTRLGVAPLHLPDLDQATLTDKINDFHQALADSTRRRDTVKLAAQEKIRDVLAWLWEVAAGPVLHQLGIHEPPRDGTDVRQWPRLWWAPGGLLGLLPIHAAGHHTSDPDPDHRCVMDRVVSSYTPTITALRYARQHTSNQAPPTGDEQALIVAMPTTPGLRYRGRLPKVAREADLVAARLPGAIRLTEPSRPRAATPGANATGIATDISIDQEQVTPTRAHVLAHLPDCVIAHFACHGQSDPTDPSQSKLLLHDHQDDPLTVASLAPLTLRNARLAYLSACSTALTSDTQLLDEAIHLASAFQMAGFPHVIGTLWPISDAYAVQVADTFYTILTSHDPATDAGPNAGAGASVDISRAPYALHHAVQTLRSQLPLTPSLWAAFLHTGA